MRRPTQFGSNPSAAAGGTHGRYHDRGSSGGISSSRARDTRPTRFGDGSGGGGGGGDSFTEVTYERTPGVGSKVQNSLAGLFLGPLFIVLGCLLLWHNEKWSIKTHRSLNEALANYVAIRDASAPPSDNLQDRLVHVTGQLTVDGSPPVDSTFGLERADALSLSRHVEVYQWVESHKTERRKLQNGETEVLHHYNYNKRWVDRPVDSSNFRHFDGHDNYGTSLPFQSETVYADGVKLGVYSVSKTLSSQLRASSPVPASAAKQLPEGTQIIGDSIYFYVDGGGGGGGGGDGMLEGGNGKNIGGSPDSLIDKEVTSIDGEDKIMYTVRATGEIFFSMSKAREAAAKASPAANTGTASLIGNRALSRNTGEAMIGDVRVKFSEVQCKDVSILAKLTKDNALVPWPSKQGSGYDIGMLEVGYQSPNLMISSAQSANNVFMWVKRAGGWLLNLIGYSMITQIVSTAADISLSWIPFLGPMSMSVINLGLTVANIVLATTTSLPVAAVAWIVYRPVIGITLLFGSFGIFYAASQAGGGNIKLNEKQKRAKYSD